MKKHIYRTARYLSVIFLIIIQNNSNTCLYGENDKVTNEKREYPEIQECRRGQWYRSSDFGMTWVKIEKILLPEKIVVIRNDSTILKSIDSGKSWTNIERISDFELNFYPNPCYSKLTLQINNTEVVRIGIYNNLGLLLKSDFKLPDQDLTMNINDFSPGNYFVGIVSNIKAKLFNLIIE